jgi:allophanate hydrolase subunit 2
MGVANDLLSNEPDAACVEMALGIISLKALSAGCLAVAGAEAAVGHMRTPCWIALNAGRASE